MQLPISPENTKMINAMDGFFTKEDFVYYLHKGYPIYCHSKEDINTYRYVLANLVITQLCTSTEISRALGIHLKNVQRYMKALEENGTTWFFNREDNRGQCHKLTEDRMT